MRHDNKYETNCMIDLFKARCYPMRLIPATSSVSKTGKTSFIFDDSTAVFFNGTYVEESYENPDLSLTGTTRSNAVIKFINQQIIDGGIMAKISDAIDLLDTDGFTLKRYIITGFGIPPGPAGIFSVVDVTEEDKAFKR